MLQEPEHFIAALVGLHKRRIPFEKINQPLLLVFELEIIILFLEPDDLAIRRVE